MPHPRPALLDFARDLTQEPRPAATASVLPHAEPHLRLVTAAVERVGKVIKGGLKGPRGEIEHWY